MPHKNYHTVSVVDVEQLLPFVKQETHSVSDEIKEENRVKEELQKFIEILKKHAGEQIYYIGEEKKFGKHLERFLFQKGGFLEVVLEQPVAINAHFIEKKMAMKFCKGLKKAAYLILPESEVKKLFIDSIMVSKPTEEALTYDKWDLMHSISLHKTLTYTLIAAAIFLLAAVIQESFELLNGAYFHLNLDLPYVDIINSLFIAICFEYIKKIANKFVAKVLESKK